MKVSVIIPTYNRREVIQRSLPAVLNQTFPADEYEVLVVVDGSTDGTADALRRLDTPVRLRVLEQDNRGQAAARNTGITAATGELVLLLDDDLFCEPNLIAEHVKAHDEGPALVFGPVLVASQSVDNSVTKWLRVENDAWLTRLQKDGVTWPDDAIVRPNSSVGRDIIVANGGFDERFVRAFEDWELGYRLWKSNLRFRFCPSARTRQYYSKSADDFIKTDAPQWGSIEVLFCRKHPEMRTVWSSASEKRSVLVDCLARLPFSADPLFKMLEMTARSDARKIRKFRARLNFAMYRSAIRAAGGWRDFRRDFGQLLPVLRYHRVAPGQPGTLHELTVSPERFRRQMAWLKRKGYLTIRAADWVAWCHEGTPLPPKPILITFDDAYEDLVENAFPVLLGHDFVATVFVVAGEIGGRNSLDAGHGTHALRRMSMEQIRHWSGQGIEFGASGRTHSDLTTLSADKIEEEITGSARDLADTLGEAPRSFAYPLGMHNEAVRRQAAEVFPMAFTGDEGLNGLRTDLHQLRRTMIRPTDSLRDFALRVRLGGDPIDSLRALLWPRSRTKPGES